LAVGPHRTDAFDRGPAAEETITTMMDIESRTIHGQADTLSARTLRPDGRGFGTLVGRSDSMMELYETLQIIGPSTASVLIVGESGTGKELVARMLHDLSDRRSHRFVAMNCAAVPETLMESELFGHEKGAFTGALDQKPGCFELANHGTLFLDELSAMPLASQVKLLRVLEERSFRRLRGTKEISVDVRIVAAMNEDPEGAVEKRKLRADLLFRLNVFTLRLPPLRDRTSDVPLLAEYFVTVLSAAYGKKVRGIDPEALDILSSYHWPGNVRELRNVMERAVILEKSDRLLPSTLSLPVIEGVSPRRERPPSSLAEPEAAQPIASIGMTIDEATRRLILRTLEATRFNRTKAAALLGVSSKTIYNKLRAWQIDIDSQGTRTVPNGTSGKDERAIGWPAPTPPFELT
jgi:transcriptional regulator with PAS, ATPase and Fis domain